MMVSAAPSDATESSYPRLLPGLGVSALVSTVLLILIGSIVRVTGHGLGCPDWPLCYGRAIPPGFAGAWVEFSHRLAGALTSAQIVALAALSWRWHRQDKWILRPALAAAGLLVVQILLGGLHVMLEIPPETGLTHTGVAMLIVGLIALVVANTLPAAKEMQRSAERDLARGSLSNWVGAVAAATYLLLLTGSYVTRSGASLACPSFPNCGQASEALRRLVDIQMLHRLAAFAVAALTIVLLLRILRRSRDRLRGFCLAMGGVLALQFALGIANVLLRLPMWSRALHLTVAAAFWSGIVVLWTITTRAHRFARADTEPLGA